MNLDPSIFMSIPKAFSINYFTLYQTTNIWTGPKFKEFADDKSKVDKNNDLMISFIDRNENMVRKGENAGYQHFPLFPQCFQKASVSVRVVKSRN